MLNLILILLALGVLCAGAAMLPVPRGLALFLAVAATVLGGVALVLRLVPA